MKYRIKDIPELVFHGRNGEYHNSVALFWSCSGIEMNWKGKDLFLDVESDYNLFEQWVSVVLNGTHLARFPLQKGRHVVPILLNMNPEKVNHVEIVKDVQSQPTDDVTNMILHGIETDGTFLPVPEKALKLEIIGDSITSAEGAIGAKDETDWLPFLFSAVRGYAFMTAQKLNADLHVLSESGWGALSSWDNDPKCAIPLYYKQVCGTIQGEKNALYGAQDAYDFDKWNADVVVINLGANDNSAFYQPPHVDPETGEAFKQNYPADLKRLQQRQYDFLCTVRKRNPNAHILWCHGMLGNPLEEPIKEVVAKFVANTGDKKTEYFRLPNEPADGYGARSHPGLPMHECAAKALTEKIRSLL